VIKTTFLRKSDFFGIFAPGLDAGAGSEPGLGPKTPKSAKFDPPRPVDRAQTPFSSLSPL
jgi:hypothetical protein